MAAGEQLARVAKSLEMLEEQLKPDLFGRWQLTCVQFVLATLTHSNLKDMK